MRFLVTVLCWLVATAGLAALTVLALGVPVWTLLRWLWIGGTEVWEIAVPCEGERGQHKTILQNVVNAILDGEALIAPGSDGIHSIELANAMLYSSWTGATVELPLDGDAYEAALNDRIANSTFVKTVREVVQTDMSKTF